MILNCPHCVARFLVADALIPHEGRTVRCGSCAHQWFVERSPTAVDLPPAEEPPPALDPALEAALSAPPVPPAKNTNVPALAAKEIPLRPFMITAPIFALLWFVLAFITHASRWVEAPVIGGIYEAFGITSTKGLAFAEVKMEREDEETKTRFILSGKIINHAEVERKVPIVRVLLKDLDGGEVWSRDYPVNIALKPGEDYPFRIVNVETSFAEKVSTIVMDVGNSLELMRR